MKIKEKTAEATATTKRVLKNSEQFIQASALIVVAAFSWYAVHKLNVSNVTSWVVTVALVITGLRAFVEYVKFLDR